MNQRELFLRHVGQTSPAPLALEIVKAEGSVLWDAAGKSYIDLIGGISVASTGHRHPKVLRAIREQLDAYLHIMVYGEFVETPQVQYASLLASHLPPALNSVFFTNSGAEAVEGAMKLAKRSTFRSKIIACENSYHGSTQGALSIIGSEYWRNAYRPLLPGILHLPYNSQQLIDAIDETTACVMLETVQAEAGIIAPEKRWLEAVRKKCTDTGTLLILDEIQTGFGRTGRLWGFEHFNIVPDILLLGKALGGGMPLGAFVADQKLMLNLADNPVLGHISTFGGHPVCCAAGAAAFKVLLEDELYKAVPEKEQLFLSRLKHPAIRAVRSFGLLIAVAFNSFETNKKIIDRVIEKGALTDWFLFESNCLRICPPLTISESEIEAACSIILDAASF
ncbi:aspartate aminotransferase family protein [Niabella insulamsoli]|uniref:aspartate aminotransferase family protein n=1 Tax=Niabella insulamsoli TaxID=3144874 RepID=UPI0031FC6BE1